MDSGGIHILNAVSRGVASSPETQGVQHVVRRIGVVEIQYVYSPEPELVLNECEAASGSFSASVPVFKTDHGFSRPRSLHACQC